MLARIVHALKSLSIPAPTFAGAALGRTAW